MATVFYALDHELHAPLLVSYDLQGTTFVFSVAGLRSYKRLVINPSSKYYRAVTHLPREEQGDDACRALAFILYRYFSELPFATKAAWTQQATSRGELTTQVFEAEHAALLASAMEHLENGKEVWRDVEYALEYASECLPHFDMDLFMPSITSPRDIDALGQLFGEPLQLTTAARALPSLPELCDSEFSSSAHQSLSRQQKELLRRLFCELVDTEERYVTVIGELVQSLTNLRRTATADVTSNSRTVTEVINDLFPECLNRILQINSSFCSLIRALLEKTEDIALEDIQADADSGIYLPLPPTKDPTGIITLAEILYEQCATFAEPYGRYVNGHGRMRRHLWALKRLSEGAATQIREISEKQLLSMLIEPVQRLPRYNMFVETFLKELPVDHPAAKPLRETRAKLSEICLQHHRFSPQAMVMKAKLKKRFAKSPELRNQTRVLSTPNFMLFTSVCNAMPELHAAIDTSLSMRGYDWIDLDMTIGTDNHRDLVSSQELVSRAEKKISTAIQSGNLYDSVAAVSTLSENSKVFACVPLPCNGNVMHSSSTKDRSSKGVARAKSFKLR